MSDISEAKEAPIYWGEKLWFIDDQYNYERDLLDNNVIDVLIARGIGDKICPTAGDWVQFCLISSILRSETGKFIAIPDKRCSREDIEKYSWSELWRVFGDVRDDDCYDKGLFNKEFTASILRIFIPRHNTGYVPLERPYNRSYFVERWSFSFNTYPDNLNDKTCNVKICHLKRGKEVADSFLVGLFKCVEQATIHLTQVLEEVNKAITQ